MWHIIIRVVFEKLSSNPNHDIKSMEIKSNPVGIREIIQEIAMVMSHEMCVKYYAKTCKNALTHTKNYVN